MSKQLLAAMDVGCSPLAREPLSEPQVVELVPLITGDRRGTWVYYRVHSEVLGLSSVLVPVEPTAVSA